jgi:hypothetical protein
VEIRVNTTSPGRTAWSVWRQSGTVAATGTIPNADGDGLRKAFELALQQALQLRAWEPNA